MLEHSLLLALIPAFVLGLRHGIELDHLAAITDVTSTQPDRDKALRLGTFYAIGHAIVVAALGLMAISLGATLPGWVDSSMGYLVGLTLVLLAGYVLVAVRRARRTGERLRIKSRWGVLLDGLSWSYEKVRSVVTRRPMRPPHVFFEEYVPKTALAVGMIHGVGAETPTQVLLFAGAAGFAGGPGATLLLVAFITGMLITNTAAILASSYGYASAARSRTILTGAVVATATLSLVVGAFFLLGADSALPSLFPEG